MKKTILFGLTFIVLIFIGCRKNNAEEILSTQQKVFKEYWELYDRHYPLMHRKNINWESIYNTYYKTITPQTTDAQLFEILKEIMQEKLKDGHTSIMLNNDEYWYNKRPSLEMQIMISSITNSKINYMAGSENNDYLSYGTLVDNANIGYIRSKTFEPINDGANEFNNYKIIVDAALDALKNKNGIIVDVRTNGGGQLSYAMYLAGRFFVDNQISLQRKRYKIQEGSEESSLSDWVTNTTSDFDGVSDTRAEGGTIASTYSEENIAHKSGAFQYTNKVAVLTSGQTASAAEFFTVAMKSQSHVKTIGNNTFGIFSGSEFITLKEGDGKWKTRISVHDTEVMYHGTFQSLEGIGVKPDELILPTSSDILDNKDVHINSAITYLN